MNSPDTLSKISSKKTRREHQKKEKGPIFNALYLPAELPPKNFASKARSSWRMRASASATASASDCIFPKPGGGR
jgi:hypothetical protein